VRDVAVVGRPDPRWGEAVHAVIVLRDGEAASESDLAEWCTGRLASYKRPKSFSFIADNDMPRTATGKILHRELKKRL
jgi:acyl-CoA synthetase (AMP-forming)/AMP-acid ligase II